MNTEKKHYRFFYGYVVAAAGFVIWLIAWGSYAISFGVFFKPLLAEFHWTRAETSLAFSLSLLVRATLGITMGWLTDKLGPRLVVPIISSFVGWSFLLISQVNALWQFVVCYAVVGGIGASVLNVPIMATVSRWFVKRRGLMTGIVQAGAGIGGLVIAPFVGWLTIGYGWRTASLVLGVMSAALLILAGLFLRRDPRDIGQFPDGVGTETADEVRPRKQNPKASVISLRPFVSTASFWMIAGIYASFGFFRSALTVHIAAHVQDLGFSLPDAANVLAIVSVASIIGRVGMGRVADKVGNRRTLIISFITTTLIIVWLTIAGNLWDFYLFAIVYGFGWGALAVLRYSVTAEIFGLASVGFIMGTLGFPESLASAFSSYLGGVFFDLSGSYNTLYIICIAVSFLGVLLSWRLKPSRFVTENAITTFQEEGDM